MNTKPTDASPIRTDPGAKDGPSGVQDVTDQVKRKTAEWKDPDVNFEIGRGISGDSAGEETLDRGAD